MEIYRLVFNPIDVNTYILAGGDGSCAIIDCGCYDQREFRRLADFLETKSLKPVLLLNTHCHLDHIFGDGMMLQKFGLRSFCHAEDLPNRKNAVSHAMMFGLVMENPPDTAGHLTDNQIVPFAGSELRILHVPGHSPGSISIYAEDDNSVFTGDALFEGSIGRTDLPGGNYETLINSIRSKLFTLPEETVVYPGHGESTTIGIEIMSNPYFIHN